ncbi:YheC/YheD family protein [Paenibacillus protaetiae]|uniref:YheC/YheD family protein n=1 Tax=Paenibacillus protaetiae TaxID=2509456 RepID=A0A4P6F4F3_9BACL|nr:YheC/YheD family protein [Paenibacillus protaetiae]QAY65268.1 YheC/YheD family protein [Paenibacillus protaetiae]
MKTYDSTSVKSKWTKTNWLLGSAATREHMPSTMPFNRRNLIHLLDKYTTVFFKPTNGSGGFRIIRITKLDNGYRTQHNTSKITHAGIKELYRHLNAKAKRRDYLLQKGIKLDKANGRPYDIRVMVQKANDGRWKTTALFTKIGQPGKVATNYNQGGKIGYFRQTLADAGCSEQVITHKKEQLERLGEATGKLFDQHASGFRELGLDVALDERGRIWILEVNTKPQFYPLKQLKHKSMYHTIMSYAKQYGRKK